MTANKYGFLSENVLELNSFNGCTPRKNTQTTKFFKMVNPMVCELCKWFKMVNPTVCELQLDFLKPT